MKMLLKMIDRFGENVKTLAYDMTSFRLITEVSVSPPKHLKKLENTGNFDVIWC